jgi:hypothetical protein
LLIVIGMTLTFSEPISKATYVAVTMSRNSVVVNIPDSFEHHFARSRRLPVQISFERIKMLLIYSDVKNDRSRV